MRGGVTFMPGFASSVSARSGLLAFPIMKVRHGVCLEKIVCRDMKVDLTVIGVA